MIRYHSCYPWHTGGAYRHFMVDKDYLLMKWVLEFNKCDLYTKDNDIQVILSKEEELWKYYEEILKKYKMDGPLKW